VSGLSPQTSPGTATTSSSRPSLVVTIDGVP
jgi:hypothetical protein